MRCVFSSTPYGVQCWYFMCTVTMPQMTEMRSLTSLREKLIKTGEKVISHRRYVTFHTWTAPPRKIFCSRVDQLACTHMSGLFARSHMNAGQDGFRDESSKQIDDLIEGHRKVRSFSHCESIDHTICLLPCKFCHRLSTVAVELLPVSG